MTDHELDEALGLCCGNTEDAREHMHRTLQILHDRSERNNSDAGRGGGWERGTEELKAHLWGDLYSPQTTIYLHFLDKMDLIEHGSGIAGSWLTPDGDRILNELNRRKPLDRIVEALDA